MCNARESSLQVVADPGPVLFWQSVHNITHHSRSHDVQKRLFMVRVGKRLQLPDEICWGAHADQLVDLQDDNYFQTTVDIRGVVLSACSRLATGYSRCCIC